MENYIILAIGGMGVAAWLYVMAAIASAVSGDILDNLSAIAIQ